MKLRQPRSPRHRNRGLSLVELMVSLVIGLVIMIAVVSAYLGASGATRVAEAQARMNEDGQAVLTILAQQLRMAGNNPKQPDYDPATTARNPVYDASTYIVRGCDGTFSDIKTAADIKALTCDAGGGSAPDSIALTYEADRYNTVPTTAGVATDCLGQALTELSATPLVWDSTQVPPKSMPKAVTFTVAENRFYVGTTTAVPAPSLYCKGNGGPTPQSLVENVEDLQLFYGVAAPGAASLAVAGYLRANQFTTDAGLAALTDAERWSKAMTVRICVVVRSERPVASDLDSARYVKCDGTVETAPPDLRLRRAYSTTVVLRNRVPT
ncbi:MAG: pilW [Ramlibacter sp.]|jgi:type IV pilus assembly protein PilW|nr:pilW [Ramlibacter sp.]